MAAGDVVISRDVPIDRHGLRLIVGTVTLDGGNPTPIQLSGLVRSLDMAVVSMDGTAAPAADPSAVTSVINGTAIDVYAWKITGVGDATLIASTNNARLVSFMALGVSKVDKVT